ncbi:hypothetical protein BJ322DRAFT_1115065 [Thelephora terrestris]|uniref:Uncharacterized protein n=1 Tax=Thelephora terrestris TaxID=56493 RepID=A0A9P6L0M7_9AGAM|nr:hypothetical protein BJ322DRAFT_1115065 [Thelephora terrestris]
MSIFQSAFALKYPRDPYPSMSTPVKPFNTSFQLTGRVKIQDPFTCGTSLNLDFECDAIETKTIYPASSTFSFLDYLTSTSLNLIGTLTTSFPAASSPFNYSTNSNASMSTSVPPSPSPLLSSPLMAYRGKHSQSAGRPLTSSFLGELTADNDEDDWRSSRLDRS